MKKTNFRYFWWLSSKCGGKFPVYFEIENPSRIIYSIKSIIRGWQIFSFRVGKYFCAISPKSYEMGFMVLKQLFSISICFCISKYTFFRGKYILRVLVDFVKISSRKRYQKTINLRNSQNLILVKIQNFWIAKTKCLFSLTNVFFILMQKNMATGIMSPLSNSLNLILAKYLRLGYSRKLKKENENFVAKINYLKRYWKSHVFTHPCWEKGIKPYWPIRSIL